MYKRQELYNHSEQDINLLNWIIDDAEGGSKPHRLSKQILQAHQYAIFNSVQTKLNLNNKSDQVRLFTPAQKLADLVPYQEGQTDQSYSKVITDGQPEWLWLAESSPSQPNPIYQTISGTITTDADFSSQYNFQISDESQQIWTIYFDEQLIKAPQAKLIFSKNSTGKFIGIVNQPTIISPTSITQVTTQTTSQPTQLTVWVVMWFEWLLG